MFPLSHLARGLDAKGHELHLVSINSVKGRESVPKTFEGINAQIHLTEGPEQEVFKEVHGNEPGDMRFVRLWREHAYAKIREINPDIIICDYVSEHGAEMADELKI